MNDRTRAWTLANRLLLIVFLLALAVPSMLGWEPSRVIPVVIVTFIVAAWLSNSRRPWWGPGPAAMMRGSASKDWRRAEIRFTVITVVVVGVGLLLESVLIGRIHL
jgi:hypothetical protein